MGPAVVLLLNFVACLPQAGVALFIGRACLGFDAVAGIITYNTLLVFIRLFGSLKRINV